jgi:hypothetical protein
VASRLDEIAVALTAPMSRRRAMRLTLGAAATAYLGLPAGRASAQRPCKRTPVCEPGTRVCVASRPDGCPGCCTPSEKCCVGAPDNANTACCDEAFGYDCGPLNFYGTPSCACKPENTCQGINDPICCRPEEKCIVRGGQEPVCCKQPCGKEECCFENEDCVMGERLAPDTDFCAKPCGAGQFHCPGSGKCCDHNEECCGDGCCSGKCCRGGGSRWCCPGTLVCGSSPGQCGCPGGHRCGEDCCPAGSECCRLSFSTDILRRFGGPRIGAARYSCCSPGLEKELLDGLESLPSPPVSAFFASSASGAGARRQRGRVAASPGSADALDALAGVANLAALASDRFRSGRPDSRYRRPVRARKLALAPISPGPGIDATAARALNKLLSAEARAWTLVDAAAQAHARSLGAIRAHNASAAVSQARASGRFSAQAAKALRPLPGLRKAAAAALQSAGTPEVTISAREVLAFQSSVRRGGLPADLRARLTQLGLGGADQKRIRALILGREPERSSGSILIGPLANASTRATLGKLAKLFARRAAQSRKQPITVSKPGPHTVRGTSPRRHTSQSLRRR